MSHVAPAPRGGGRCQGVWHWRAHRSLAGRHPGRLIRHSVAKSLTTTFLQSTTARYLNVIADAGAVSQGRKLAAQSAKRAAETATKAQPNAAALAGVAASFVDGCVSHELSEATRRACRR